MEISIKNSKVNRKPLFKTRINVQESAHDGRREEESLPIAPDEKRTKITCQDDFSETEVRIASSKRENFGVVCSIKERPTEGSDDGGCSGSIIDYFNEDDSKLAALDVSDLISSHDCKSNNLNTEEGGNLVSEERNSGFDKGPDRIHGVRGSSLQKFSHSCKSRGQTNEGYKIVDSAFCKEEANPLYYGLPLKVENLIMKHKGIKKLYGMYSKELYSLY